MTSRTCLPFFVNGSCSLTARSLVQSSTWTRSSAIVFSKIPTVRVPPDGRTSMAKCPLHSRGRRNSDALRGLPRCRLAEKGAHFGPHSLIVGYPGHRHHCFVQELSPERFVSLFPQVFFFPHLVPSKASILHGGRAVWRLQGPQISLCLHGRRHRCLLAAVSPFHSLNRVRGPDSCVTFDEYCRCLSIIARGSLDEKIDRKRSPPRFTMTSY